MFREKSFLAIVWMFFLNGMIFASFATNIPHLKNTYDLGEAAIGSMLFMLAAGSVFFMVLSGVLTSEFGSKSILIVSSLLVLPMSVAVFTGAEWQVHLVLIVIFGAAMGTMDVAMNQQSALLEANHHKSVMSAMHGFFSLGALSGAILSWAILRTDLTPFVQMLGISIVAATGALLGFRHLFEEAAHEDTQENTSFFEGLKHPRLMVLSGLAFIAMFAEGTANDWSPLYLIEYVPTTADKGALGFAAFAGAMVIGRFLGDAAVMRFGRKFLVVGGGYLVAIGGAILLLATPFELKLVGLALAGLGVANLVPALFSTAAALPNLRPGVGIAFASILGYAGFLVGPPLLGYLAQNFGLDRTLWILALTGLCFAFAGRVFRRSS